MPEYVFFGLYSLAFGAGYEDKTVVVSTSTHGFLGGLGRLLRVCGGANDATACQSFVEPLGGHQ